MIVNNNYKRVNRNEMGCDLAAYVKLVVSQIWLMFNLINLMQLIAIAMYEYTNVTNLKYYPIFNTCFS